MPRKKKTEVAAVKEKAEKTLEEPISEASKEEEIKEAKSEEFPDIELGIDVFSSAETKETKKDADKEKIKEELLEKAKKLEAKIDKKPEEKEVAEEVRESEERKKAKRSEKTLFPLDDYVKYNAHLGTKAVTPKMRKFVYKRRADGLAVLNTNSIDEKLKEAAEFLKDFKPDDIFLACKREAGWKAAKKFSEVTGIKVFTKKYPAGIITNSRLNDFFEVELVIVCDPWLDKNALNDAVIIKKPVISLCDTNNLTTGATKVIPCNNKAARSLGLILYLLAREYLKARGEDKKLNLEDFAGPLEEKEEKRESDKGAKEGV